MQVSGTDILFLGPKVDGRPTFLCPGRSRPKGWEFRYNENHPWIPGHRFPHWERQGGFLQCRPMVDTQD